MTTVGFDALIYAWPPGGIATYQTGLMEALRAAGEVEVAFSGGVTGSAAFAGVPGLARMRVDQRHMLFGLNMARATGLKSDVHHLTAFWRPPGLRTRRLVLTIHDMIPERLGETYAGIKGTHYGKVKLAAKAAAIVTPSETVREDVIEMLGVAEDRVFAVPHGRPQPLNPMPGTWFEAESGRYALIVGRRGHYKNFLGVLPGIGPVLAKAGMTLVCAGGGPFTAAEREGLFASGLTQRVRQIGLAPAEMVAAYRHAFCTIVPGKAEGFGFPVLESMSNGTPVLASDIPAKREIAADAALWCDPDSADSWGAALQRLIDDSALRARLVTAGLERAQLFSWDRTARRMAAIYRAVV